VQAQEETAADCLNNYMTVPWLTRLTLGCWSAWLLNATVFFTRVSWKQLPLVLLWRRIRPRKDYPRSVQEGGTNRIQENQKAVAPN
jgi:hypothetical protein